MSMPTVNTAEMTSRWMTPSDVGDYPGQAQVRRVRGQVPPSPTSPMVSADWRVTHCRGSLCPPRAMPARALHIPTHVPSTSGLIKGSKRMRAASAVLRMRATTLPPISICLSPSPMSLPSRRSILLQWVRSAGDGRLGRPTSARGRSWSLRGLLRTWRTASKCIVLLG